MLNIDTWDARLLAWESRNKDRAKAALHRIKPVLFIAVCTYLAWVGTLGFIFVGDIEPLVLIMSPIHSVETRATFLGMVVVIYLVSLFPKNLWGKDNG